MNIIAILEIFSSGAEQASDRLNLTLVFSSFQEYIRGDNNYPGLKGFND